MLLRRSSCTRRVVSQSTALMTGVAMSIHTRLAKTARDDFDADEESQVSKLRRDHAAITEERGGVDRLVDGHMAALIDDTKVSCSIILRQGKGAFFNLSLFSYRSGPAPRY